MQAKQEIERFTADMEYFDQHRRELAHRFPDQWVAVYQGRVIGAATELDRLLSRLAKKGIPRGRAFVDYATERDDLLIL